MKKFLPCLCIFALLFLHIPANKTKALNFDGQYTFYATAGYEGEGCKTLQNGNMWQISCDSQIANDVKTQLVGVVGESVSFDGDKHAFDLVCKNLGKSLFVSNIEGLTVVEGFGSSFDKYVIKQGKKINFQVVFDGTKITVGTPTILGSF